MNSQILNAEYHYLDKNSYTADPSQRDAAINVFFSMPIKVLIPLAERPEKVGPTGARGAGQMDELRIVLGRYAH